MVTARQMESALRSVGGYGGQGWSMSTLAAGATTALQQTGITTAKGAAVFLAQCMVESAYFRTTREYGGPNTRYAPYYGRGFIQCTWETNYRSMGAWCAQRGYVPSAGYFLVPHEDRLADEKWAWLTAVWYFRTHRHDLVALANKGDNVRVGRAINRGSAYSSYASYGEAERDKAYRAFLDAGVTAPGPAEFRYDMPDFDGCWTVRRIQRNVGVPDDNVYGPSTRDAVKKAQDKLGVKTDGLWGEKTQAAMVKAQRAGTYPRPDKDEPKVEKQPASKPTKKPWRYDMPTGGMSVKQVQRIVGVAQDGIYGKSTRKAVRRLQRKLKVKPRDGLWGDSTATAYKRSQRKSNLLERGDKGRKVKKLQRKLNRVFPAYSDLTVDGIYGPSVERVIETFQRRSNLAVDGVVGPKTRRALARSGVKL